MTDVYGFTALHHAQLSKNPAFYAQLLELFNNPRTFVKKMVWYESSEKLRADNLDLHREVDPDRADGGLVTVQQVSKGSLTAWADVVPGDRLEGVFTEAQSSKRLRKIMEELMSICNSSPIASATSKNKEEVKRALLQRSAETCFPVAFEFRGPACREILADGSKALHDARKHLARMQKLQAKAVGPDGVKVVVAKKPQRAPETCFSKKKKSEDPHIAHATVLPTLLVREEKKPKAFCHPLAPIIEARVAASRAAARVKEEINRRDSRQRSKSSANLVARSTDISPPAGRGIRPSVSLPALVPSDEVAKSRHDSGSPSSPTWSRRHWLPESVQLSQAVPRKIQVQPVVQATSSRANIVTKLDTEQHELIF
jgi:hypothetical protein